MILVCKQLFRQIIRDRIFLSLLFLLTMLPPLSFFFVMFSIDGNMAVLNALNSLTENQQLYKNALHSNTFLAYNFFVSLTGLSALVFVMFFYRFFRAGKKQIGCIKALGFKNKTLQIFFVVFTAILSFSGALAGLSGGYFLSDILINANSQTYAVTGLVKKAGGFHLFTGLIAPTAVFCIVAFLCCGFVKNREAGSLLAGNDKQNSFSITLNMADKISKIMPVGKRFSLRIALRKPLSVLLLFAAVMSFSVCIILGQSLNISSAKIFAAQTSGHHYEYDIRYSKYQTAAVPGDTMIYIDSTAVFFLKDNRLERTITGLYNSNGLYEMKNQGNRLLTSPKFGKVYINPEFHEIYGVKIGDTITVDIAGGQHAFIVEDVAVNAKSNNIYMNARQLAGILGAASGAYNGVLSANAMPGDDITTKTQRIDDLRRNAVSNQISGTINQAMGVLAGAILIFLALYINFQDNTHDILILHMLGHRIQDIRKMLVDIYLPVLWSAFVITLVPGIFLAKSIQKSLSISTNDYMPFGINIFVILAASLVLRFIYWGVQMTFHSGIKRMIEKREIMEVIYAE